MRRGEWIMYAWPMSWQGLVTAGFMGKGKLPYLPTPRLLSSSSGAEGGRELLDGASKNQRNATTMSLRNTGNSRLISIESRLSMNTTYPCNRTYVSVACWGSPAGAMHGAPKLQLGRIRAPNERCFGDGRTDCRRPVT